MSRLPWWARAARRVFALTVDREAGEFVLGDLDEQTAARLARGGSPAREGRWLVSQLTRSAPALWKESFMKFRVRGLRGRMPSAPSVLGDAVRNLRRSPGRAAAVAAVMALGVGANATMFGALDRLFLSPPAHVESPDRVKRLFVESRRANGPELTVQETHAFPSFTDWQGVDAFESTAAFSRRELTEGRGETAERIRATMVTSEYLGLLGVEPELGRFFLPEDDTFAAEPVTVLGYGYWQRHFGGRRDAIGQTLHVGDVTYTVIGVTPPGFSGVDLERVDVWLPLHRAALVEEGGTEWVDARGWYFIQAIGRLRDGVSAEAASAAATLAHRNGYTERPEYLEREPRILVEPLILARSSLAPAEARVIPWVMGVALMVLILACANVANLLLAGALRNRRATAVRNALGAGRARLIATGMAEATLMALAGGAAAILVSIWGGRLLSATAFPGIEWALGAQTWRVVLFSVVLAVGAGLVSGLLPAARAGRSNPVDALRASGRSMTRAPSRLRSSLLVLQAAISVVLLIGTGLFVRSLLSARNVDLGFDPDGVLLVSLQPDGGYPGGEAMTSLYREARRALASLPGSPTTAISTTVPFRNTRGIGDDLRIPGLDSLPRTGAGAPYIHTITDGYFEATGVRILRGRPIVASDDAETAPPVAVVNETMARLAWPDQDALGRCLILQDGPCTRVVGIAADSHRFGLDEPESMHYYLPLAHSPYPWPPSGLFIRAGDVASLTPVVRRALDRNLSGIRFVRTTPYRELVDPSFRSWELGAKLFAAFGLLALLVAAIGLYSVLAFDVAERRPEMGLRAALGATRGRIMQAVVSGGLRLAVTGIALGLAAGLFASRYAADLLFETSPREPVVLAAVVVLMLLVALLACWLPAWRASRVDPMQTLRSE